MTRKTEVLRMMDLAERKGFKVRRSTVRDHWRLIDEEGNSVRKQGTKSAAFTVSEAAEFLATVRDST